MPNRRPSCRPVSSNALAEHPVEQVESAAPNASRVSSIPHQD